MFGKKKKDIVPQKPVRFKKSKKRQLSARLRGYFLTGLIVTVPVGITYWALRALIRAADRMASGYFKLIPNDVLERYSLQDIPGLGMAITLTFVLVAGFLARNIIGRKLVGLGERIIEKIPLVRSIYSASKQLLETVFAGSEEHFERVVLVEYPRKGIRSIGFVTGHADGYSREILPEPHLHIFIPTTPNPTSGWYILLPEKDVIPINLTVEQAFKIIISAGMVMPQKMITEAGLSPEDKTAKINVKNIKTE